FMWEFEISESSIRDLSSDQKRGDASEIGNFLADQAYMHHRVSVSAFVISDNDLDDTGRVNSTGPPSFIDDYSCRCRIVLNFSSKTLPDNGGTTRCHLSVTVAN